MLRDRKLGGLKFRRQVPIGRYVVDFLCLRHRLIVEADGPFHEEGYDSIRDSWLQSQGFRVLRFDNGQIHNTPDAVAEAIQRGVEAPEADLSWTLSAMEPFLRGDTRG